MPPEGRREFACAVRAFNSQMFDGSSLGSWRASRDENPAEEARVTVPTNVQNMLQRTLGGPLRRCCPLSSRPVHVRVWCGSWCVLGLCAGYASLIFKSGSINPAPDNWAAVGYCGLFAFTAMGLIFTESSYQLASIAQCTGGETVDQIPALDEALAGALETRENHASPTTGDIATQSFLRDLLQSDVTPAASKVLAQQVRWSILQVGVVILLICYQAVGNITRPERLEHIWRADVAFAIVCFWVSVFPALIISIGWLIFMKAPCIIVCDRIKYSAARVRQMQSDNADYDAVMGYLHEAHTMTVRLGALLSPLMFGVTLACSLVAAQWVFAAMTVQYSEVHNLPGWVEEGTGRKLVHHLPVPAWLLCASVVMQYPVVPLFAAGSTTSACEELMEAVASLRGSHSRMATPEDLIRIQGLLHFSADVNHGAGLGFVVRRQLLTLHWIRRLQWKIALGILVFFSSMLYVLQG